MRQRFVVTVLSHPPTAGWFPIASNRSNALRNTVWATSSASDGLPNRRSAVANTSSWYFRTNASNWETSVIVRRSSVGCHHSAQPIWDARSFRTIGARYPLRRRTGLLVGSWLTRRRDPRLGSARRGRSGAAVRWRSPTGTTSRCTTGSCAGHSGSSRSRPSRTAFARVFATGPADRTTHQRQVINATLAQWSRTGSRQRLGARACSSDTVG